MVYSVVIDVDEKSLWLERGKISKRGMTTKCVHDMFMFKCINCMYACRHAFQKKFAKMPQKS